MALSHTEDAAITSWPGQAAVCLVAGLALSLLAAFTLTEHASVRPLAVFGGALRCAALLFLILHAHRAIMSWFGSAIVAAGIVDGFYLAFLLTFLEVAALPSRLEIVLTLSEVGEFVRRLVFLSLGSIAVRFLRRKSPGTAAAA